MAKTVFVTGGSGFVGSSIVRRLLDGGHHVRSLERSPREGPLHGHLETVEGDILDSKSLDGAMDGCDAVIHLVGIIEEHPGKGITFERIYVDGSRNVVDAAVAAGVPTFVYMSANGARADGVSSYQTGKWAAEEMVRGGGFDSSTVLRPSLIFGPPVPGRREFSYDLLNQLIKPFPVLPIFGDGRYQMQPVSVDSVARGFVSAAVDPEPGARSFGVAGPSAMSYVDIVDTITRASGRSVKPKAHVPLGLVRMGLGLAGWTGLLPISNDQLEMLIEGNTCDHAPFHDAFGIEPVPFSEANLGYLR